MQVTNFIDRPSFSILSQTASSRSRIGVLGTWSAGEPLASHFWTRTSSWRTSPDTHTSSTLLPSSKTKYPVEVPIKRSKRAILLLASAFQSPVTRRYSLVLGQLSFIPHLLDVAHEVRISHIEHIGSPSVSTVGPMSSRRLMCSSSQVDRGRREGKTALLDPLDDALGPALDGLFLPLATAHGGY